MSKEAESVMQLAMGWMTGSVNGRGWKFLSMPHHPAAYPLGIRVSFS